MHPSSSSDRLLLDNPHVPPHSSLLLSSLDTSTMSEYDDDGVFAVPPRPRRLWKVNDTTLPLYPPFYPPPTSACVVTDAPPSVLAVRISECLRRRSIVVEYDEATCVCTTVDACKLHIRLWRTARGGVLVECQRTRGPVDTYHWTVQAILQAAQSLDTGEDRRSWRQTSCCEYPRLLASSVTDTRNLLVNDTTEQPNVVESLEHAWQLLTKDRWSAHVLGMESLVALSDWHTVGVDAALYVALAILGASEHAFLEKLQKRWIYRLVAKRLLPEEDDAIVDSTAVSSAPNHLDAHAALLRSLALVTVTNALSVLATHQPATLKSILQGSVWTCPELLHTLTEDLQVRVTYFIFANESSPHTKSVVEH
jgi:hypothetical protein